MVQLIIDYYALLFVACFAYCLHSQFSNRNQNKTVFSKNLAIVSVKKSSVAFLESWIYYHLILRDLKNGLSVHPG